MEDSLIYVYCISDSIIDPKAISGHKNLKCSVFQEFSAITKHVSPDEFSQENLKKNFTDIGWIEPHVRDHIRIISEVMKHSTVVPFKFGTIFNSEESLGKFIHDYSVSLTENLENIKGKEEWSVKVYCDRSLLNQQIGEISEEVHALEEEIQKSMPGKAFLLKRKKVEVIEKELEKIIRKYGQSCYEEIAALSELTQTNNLLPKDLTERTDDMILNVSCFVDDNKVNALLAVIGELHEEYKNFGFTLDAVGPWPPFSFTLIKEK